MNTNNANIGGVVYSNKSNISNNIRNSLSYYKQQTKEHVEKHLSSIINGGAKEAVPLVRYILRNEDLFSNLMTAVMLADHTYDSSRGSLKHWRNQNCLWTINETLRKADKINCISLSEFSYKHNPIDDLIEKEFMQKFEDRLDEVEQQKHEIYNLYHREGWTEHEIAAKYNISQQKVSMIIVGLRQWMKKIMKA